MVDFKVDDLKNGDVVILNSGEKFTINLLQKSVGWVDFHQLDTNLKNKGFYGGQGDIKEIYRDGKLIWSREKGLIKLIPVPNELKFADIVTLRNGAKAINLNNNNCVDLMLENKFRFSNYRVDLMHYTDNNYDIMSIMRDGKLIFEREEVSKEILELQRQLEEKENLLKEVSKVIDEIKAKLK